MRAADATTPIDYTHRNATYAPGGTVAPGKQAPAVNSRVQDKRVTPPAVDKPAAAVGDRRAAIEVTEAQDKTVREKDSRRPETVERATSAVDQRRATISTADTTKPPMVAKYQDSMATATPWGPGAAVGNTPRFRPLDGATQAKINRFIYRRNPAEASPSAGAAPSAVLGGTMVTPAAGGSVIQK